MSSTHDAKIKGKLKAEMPRPMSPAEKEATIRSTVASMALEGLEISYEEVAELLEQSLKEPVKKLV